MAVKLVFVLFVLAIIISVAVIAAYRYFDRQAEREHEKEMLREKRDAEVMTGSDSYIERELEREENQ